GGNGATLGCAEASQVLGPNGGLFVDLNVDGTAVLVKYTLAGDSNLDRTIDLTDFTFMAANFNGTNKSWLQGDYNYDGKVDLTDFTFLTSNFNRSLPAAAMSNVGTTVPEPAALAVYGATAAIALAHGRRRRR